MIGGACMALVLGMAVVAPTTSRGAGPVPAPSNWVLSDTGSPTGALVGRSLVELPAVVPGPGQEQSSPPDPASERLRANKMLEAARARN